LSTTSSLKCTNLRGSLRSFTVVTVLFPSAAAAVVVAVVVVVVAGPSPVSRIIVAMLVTQIQWHKKDRQRELSFDVVK